ncbi:MAG: hypothetical protein H0V27_04585 [Pyrinomonadaceae bacterium]|nr:hypothetical protein [Pyrinomonadaceae bacterium]
MFRKHLSFTLIALLVCAAGAEGARAAQNDQEAPRVEAVKQRIGKIGVGERARVTIKLRDSSEVKGYIYRAGDDNFIVADSKTGARTTVSYADVAEVKRKRQFTTLKTVAITIGTLMAIGAITGAVLGG